MGSTCWLVGVDREGGQIVREVLERRSLWLGSLWHRLGRETHAGGFVGLSRAKWSSTRKTTPTLSSTSTVDIDWRLTEGVNFGRTAGEDDQFHAAALGFGRRGNVVVDDLEIQTPGTGKTGEAAGLAVVLMDFDGGALHAAAGKWGRGHAAAARMECCQRCLSTHTRKEGGIVPVPTGVDKKNVSRNGESHGAPTHGRRARQDH